MSELRIYPSGRFEDQASRKRRKFRELLQKGETLKLGLEGTMGEIMIPVPNSDAILWSQVRDHLEKGEPLKSGNAITPSNEETIEPPQGIFMGEDAAAKKRRELREGLRERLLAGKTVEIAQSGNAMNSTNEKKICIPEGIFAGEDAAAKKRRELRELLEKGETVKIAKSGNAINQSNEATVAVGKGKLAAQWYEANPALLTMEKAAMQHTFPQFTLDKLDDGRLCWVGILEPGIYESKFGEKRQYHVMAVYDNNHPNQQMGSSVRVYPLMPDVDELIEMAGFRPFHLLTDSVGNLYLCTNEAKDQKIGITTTTAASVLGWATKWLIAFELVLTGDLPVADFNRHGGI